MIKGKDWVVIIMPPGTYNTTIITFTINTLYVHDLLYMCDLSRNFEFIWAYSPYSVLSLTFIKIMLHLYCILNFGNRWWTRLLEKLIPFAQCDEWMLSMDKLMTCRPLCMNTQGLNNGHSPVQWTSMIQYLHITGLSSMF